MPGRLTKQSKQNLQRDWRVLGKNWGTTYKGYFSRSGPMKRFSKLVIPLLLNEKRVRILYVCSGPGALGEQLCKELKKEGKTVTLTLHDMSAQHLKQNKNSKTRKIVGDLLTEHVQQKFDVVIMRSSLDYFSKESLQVNASKRIYSWLPADGLFANQTASLGSLL